MSLVLHPRAAPGDRLLVWLGALNHTAAPTLTWTLDGQAATPNGSPLRSARPPELLAGDPPRVFCGLFEFDGLEPGSLHEVAVSAGGERATLRARTLPAAVPQSRDGSFNVLMVSCFHAAESEGGRVREIVARIPDADRPHLTLLMGDQVYLDLPTLRNFPSGAIALAEQFERDYLKNWFQEVVGYRSILGLAPSAAMPDDHEYWNNAPHASPIIQNSWTVGGRANWTQAAQALYDGFQAQPPRAPFQHATVIDVAPLSIFLMDTRTFRRPDRTAAMSPGALAELQTWARRVGDDGHYGIVVSGQSLLDAPTSRLQGTVGDRHLIDYGDYDAIVGALVGLSQRGRPVLCLTGDVHFGRMTRIRDPGRAHTSFYEVISSPTALVRTVGADQASKLFNTIGSFFGRERDPWPRHSGAQPAPEKFARNLGRFSAERMHTHLRPEVQKGDHVAMLSFRAIGDLQLELTVTYYPIHADDALCQPRVLPPIKLAS